MPSASCRPEAQLTIVVVVEVVLPLVVEVELVECVVVECVVVEPVPPPEELEVVEPPALPPVPPGTSSYEFSALQAAAAPSEAMPTRASPPATTERDDLVANRLVARITSSESRTSGGPSSRGSYAAGTVYPTPSGGTEGANYLHFQRE